MAGRAWITAGALLFGSAAALVAYRGLNAPAPARVASEPVVATTPGPRADSAADVQRLRAELGLLQGQILALRERADQQKPAETAEKVEDPEELDPATLAVRREEDAARWKDHMAEVAVAFEEENFDHGFATPAKSAIERAFQDDPVMQAAAGNIECRAHTCRVEIQDARSPAVSKQLPLFVHTLGGALPRAEAEHIDGADGRSTAVLYLTTEQPTAQIPRR